MRNYMRTENAMNIKIEHIGDRLKRRRKELKLTQKQIANAVGVSAGSVTQWELEYTSPKGENLIALSKVLQCSPDWLLSGSKNKSATPKGNATWLGQVECCGNKIELGEHYVKIPFFNEIELSAEIEAIAQNKHDDKLMFAVSTLKQCGVDPAHAVGVKVRNNSMEPVLADGSTVVIDTSKTSVVDGKMFVIFHDGMLRIQTLYRVPGNGIRIKSFNNEEYPDEIYVGEEVKYIRILGKVFWYSSIH